jgi:putative Holliday junction resolvase
MSVLGVDPGQRRIGLAVSDELELTARPLYAIESQGHRLDAARVAEIAAAQGVKLIVVGRPLRMSGEVGPAARRAQRLAQALRRATELPVELWDERLSTVEAERALIEGEVSREKRRDLIDAAAAAIILQSYLDQARG